MSKFKTLLLVSHAINNHPSEAALKQLFDNVAKRTDNQLVIAKIQDNALGNSSTMLGMVVDGKADMATPPHNRFSDCVKKFGCIGLPFAFDDHAHANRVLKHDFLDWVRPDLDALGILCLDNWEWGFRQITNNRRPILSPEDMRGLKIRIPPVLSYQATILALGAMPVITDYGRLPDVIRQGLADGQENPVALIYLLCQQSLQKYVSLINHSYGTIVPIISKKSFEKLTREEQVILREEIQKAGQLMHTLFRSQEAAQLEELACLGVQIDRPDPAPFRVLMEPVYDKISATFGAQNVKTFRDIVERHR